MPIRPELRHLYRGQAWRDIRARMLARAKNLCEQCGRPNGAVVVQARDLWAHLQSEFNGRPGSMDDYIWYDSIGSPVNMPYEDRPTFGECFMKAVQCGVAHLDHDPRNNSDENLSFLCRRCHLAHDRTQHKHTRSTRKDSTRPLLAAVEARV